MTEYSEFPENIVVAPTRRDFYRVAAKYDLEPVRTHWSRPRAALYGVRVMRIIVSATVLAAPPPDFDQWVRRSLMCRLAHDGQYIEETRKDAPEG